MHSNRNRPLLLLAANLTLSTLLGGVAPALAQSDTLLMSVLNSRRHAWGRSDNPRIGIFLSADGGRTWDHRGWRQYIRTFFTAKGPDGTFWSACGNGVLRSRDNGLTWRITTGWEVTEVLKLAVDPRDPHRIAAATAYGPILTTDGGNTWKFLREGLSRLYVSDVCIDRTTGDLLVPTELGVFTRGRKDSTWKPASLRGFDTRVIVQDPDDPRVFWAGTEDDGVWRSADRGHTWTPRNDGLAHLTVYAIAITPSPNRTLFLGTHGGGVYRSDNDGAVWRPKSNGLTNLDVHTLVVPRSRAKTVLAGTLNGGLFESTDNGDSWRFNSQDDAQVWGLWGEQKTGQR